MKSKRKSSPGASSDAFDGGTGPAWLGPAPPERRRRGATRPDLEGATRRPSTKRRVRRNPLFGTPFVRTKGELFPGAPVSRPAKRWKNPLIVSPSYKHPELDAEERVVGEAPNPSAWERALMTQLEVTAGSLGGFGWNYLAGTTIRTLGASERTNEILGYVSAAAPALAFATLFAGDEPWKAAMAGASLYDFWTALARKLNIGQLEPSPPAGPT